MPEYDLWARKVCHVYLCRPALRHGDPRETGHAALWMPLRTAAALLGNAGDRAFVAALLG
jgi:8-oxo-dGTP diphosphatase